MASTITPASIIPGLMLTAVISTYYTVPVLTSLKITQLTVYNSDTLAHQVTVFLAAGSGEGGNPDVIAKLTLSSGQSASVYQAIDQVLGQGATIQAVCDADSVVNLKASGLLIT